MKREDGEHIKKYSGVLREWTGLFFISTVEGKTHLFGKGPLIAPVIIRKQLKTHTQKKES